MMLRHAIAKNSDGDRVDFTLHVRNDNEERTPPLVSLYALCGPGDEAEPVVTVMLPHEDLKKNKTTRPGEEARPPFFHGHYMSAFLCNNSHVTPWRSTPRKTVCSAGRTPPSRCDAARENVKASTIGTARQQSRILKSANGRESRLHRGGDYQGARCLDYQSCEHPGWEKSEA